MDDAISHGFLAHAEALAEQAFLEPGFFPHSYIEILEAPLDLTAKTSEEIPLSRSRRRLRCFWLSFGRCFCCSFGHRRTPPSGKEIFLTQRKKVELQLSLIFVKSAEEKLLINHLDCGKAVS